MTLGERIRAARINKKIRQVELSGKIGVAQRMISEYENNKVVPSTEVLKKLAGIFGVTTDYLLYGEGEREGIIGDRELLRYMTIIDKLGEEDKKYIKRFLRSFLADAKIRELDLIPDNQQMKNAV